VAWIKNNKWTSLLFFILFTLLLLPVWLKPIIKHALLDMGREHGIVKVELGSLWVNPLGGRLFIHNFKLYHKQHVPPIAHIDRLDIDIHILPLLQRTVHLAKVEFTGSKIPLEINPNQQLMFAGIPLFELTQKTEKTPDQADANPRPFLFGLDELSFSNIETSLTIKDQVTSFDIEKLSLTDLRAGAEQYARLILKARLNQKPLKANLQLHLFQPQPKIVGTIFSESIDIQEFRHVIPNTEIVLAGKIHSDLTFTAQQTDNGFIVHQQGDLGVEGFHYRQGETNASFALATWTGSLLIDQQESLTVALDGDLNSVDSTFHLTQLNANLANVHLKTKANVSHSATQTQVKHTGTLTLTDIAARTEILNSNVKKCRVMGNVDINQTPQQSDFLASVFRGEIDVSDIQLRDHWGTLQLSDFNLNTDVLVNQSSDGLRIQHKGNLAAKQLNARAQTFATNVHHVTSSGPVNATFSQDSSIELEQTLNVHGLSLSESKHNQRLQTDIKLDTQSQIHMHSANTAIAHRGQLTLSNLSASQTPFAAKLNDVTWTGTTALNLADALNYVMDGHVQLHQLSAFNSNIQHDIAHVRQLNIDHFSINQEHQLAVDKLDIMGIKTGSASASNALTELEKVTLNRIRFLPKATTDAPEPQPNLALGTLTIQGSKSHITLDADNNIEQLEQLKQRLPNLSSAEVPTPKKTHQPDKSQPSFSYSIERIELKNQNQIHLSAKGMTPPILKTIELDTFQLGSVNSVQPNQTSPYEIKLRFDAFSEMLSRGSIAVLNPKKALHAETEIHEFSLADVSPLSERAIGYRIKSGQINGDFSTDIKDNKITASNHVTINQLDLSPAQSQQALNRRAQFPIPLETGLLMLQDGQHNIELDIPIKGDLNNPDFNLNDVINLALGKAVAGATRTYLLLALQPFGAVLLAGEMLIDKAGAIQLESVTFQPDSSEIDTQMQTYLSKVSHILKERDNLHLKLCNGANQQDLLAIHKKRISPPQTQTKTDPQATVNHLEVAESSQSQSSAGEEQIQQQALALAKQRQLRIKRALIDRGVTGRQIILCDPSMTQVTEHLPSVDLKI